MRIRDSGMPEETYWESLLDVGGIVEKFDFGRFRDVVELGCGYGTFSVPVARAISGTLYAFDIDPVMVDRASQRAAGLSVVGEVRDVVELGFGVRVDAVMLFNILHCEQPTRLLRQAFDALKPGGEVLVIHWRGDVATPRGPDAAIRPSPAQIIEWANEVGLVPLGEPFELLPWHFGLRLQRRPASPE